jgi:hypothetical protein
MNDIKSRIYHHLAISVALHNRRHRLIEEYFTSGDDYPVEFDKILQKEFWNILA